MGPKVVACNMRSSDVKAVPEKENSGGNITVDSELSASSENPVQNKVIYEALNNTVFLSRDNGDYAITDNANPDDFTVQSNTRNGFTTLTISGRIAKAVSNGHEARIVNIPESTKAIIGRTYLDTIGICGNTACSVTLDTWGDSGYISFYPGANVSAGAVFKLALLTFPVTL